MNVGCSICRKPLQTTRPDAKYCSTNCRQKAYLLRKSGQLPVVTSTIPRRGKLAGQIRPQRIYLIEIPRDPQDPLRQIQQRFGDDALNLALDALVKLKPDMHYRIA